MATSVSQADSTVDAIRKRVRRLTAASSSSNLLTSDIDDYINVVMTQDFPYAIKIDQLRKVYEFYTTPYIDQYPMDMNLYQGLRDPVYFEGVQGWFYKSREQFYNVFPKLPTLINPTSGDGVTQSFTFTINQVPFLRGEVVLGVDLTPSGTARVRDDGDGNMQYIFTDALGNDTFINIGTVDYVTGEITVDFSTAGVNVTPANNALFSLWVAQYEPNKPYALLFFRDGLVVRPVPNDVYKITLEAYKTPVQFMLSDEAPLLNQWWQYIAFLVAKKILEDVQDVEGIENLMPGLKEQEALVLERQGVEEIGQRNPTIYQGNSAGSGAAYPFWGW